MGFHIKLFNFYGQLLCEFNFSVNVLWTTCHIDNKRYMRFLMKETHSIYILIELLCVDQWTNLLLLKLRNNLIFIIHAVALPHLIPSLNFYSICHQSISLVVIWVIFFILYMKFFLLLLKIIYGKPSLIAKL